MMKRRKFVKKSIVGASIAPMAIPSLKNIHQNEEKEVYELREYSLKWASRQAQLDQYFKEALIPALNKNGVKNVGVFSEIGNPEPRKIFLLIPYPSFTDYIRIHSALKEDKKYIKASEAYNNIGPDEAIYFRYDTRLLLAFDGIPQLIQPQNESRIFELRTYEGFSEDAVRRKIMMFNKEELDLFYETKLNPVFFGEALAGKELPYLTYMITFKDMEERDKNWSAFGNHPEWKRMSSDPQYANSVSKITRIFLDPVEYSQL